MLPIHPLVWLVLAGIAFVAVLALVDRIRYRRRLREWRPDPPLLTETTNDPTRVWLAQAEAQDRSNRP